jgi:hypothetical protein
MISGLCSMAAIDEFQTRERRYGGADLPGGE